MGSKLTKIRNSLRRKGKGRKVVSSNSNTVPTIPDLPPSHVSVSREFSKILNKQIGTNQATKVKEIACELQQAIARIETTLEVNNGDNVSKQVDDIDIVNFEPTSGGNDDTGEVSLETPQLKTRFIRVRPKAAIGERKIPKSDSDLSSEMQQFQNDVDRLISSTNTAPLLTQSSAGVCKKRRPKAAKGVRTPLWTGPVQRTGMLSYSRYAYDQVARPQPVVQRRSQSQYETCLQKWRERQDEADKELQMHDDFDFYK